MSADSSKYMERQRLRQTQVIAQGLYKLVCSAGIPCDGQIPAEVLAGPVGGAVLDAFAASGGYARSELDLVMWRPTSSRRGLGRRVISNAEVGSRLNRLIIKAQVDGVGLNCGTQESFIESVKTYFRKEMSADAEAIARMGVMGMAAHRALPLGPIWSDRDGAMEFGEYLSVDPDLVTHHTKQQIYLAQFMSSLGKLRASDVDYSFGDDIRSATTVIEESISDLELYFFDDFSIPKLHTHRILDSVFDRSRGYKVYIARASFNATEANAIDPKGKLGSFILFTINKWLQSKKGKLRSAVRSAENTSFQFIVEKPEDAQAIFKNFGVEIKREINLEFARRYPDRSDLDPVAKELLRQLGEFEVRGTVAVVPYGPEHVVEFAIQEPSDVAAFREILELLSVPAKFVQTSGNGDDDKIVFEGTVKPFLPFVKFDVEKVKKWAMSATGVEQRRRKDLMQAFILQSVFYKLKHLAGVLDYFEKDRAPKGRASVYTEDELPNSNTDYVEHLALQLRLKNAKYVSDGTYNPMDDDPSLGRQEMLSHLPHLHDLAVQDQAHGVEDERVAKILKVWRRLSKEWGEISHPARAGSAGGAREKFFAALRELELAAERGDQGAIAEALASSVASGNELRAVMKKLWSRAISDPKNPFFVKRDTVGTNAAGDLVNVDVFTQEMARLGWTDVVAMEADSMQAFLRHYCAEFAPDFTDKMFQAAWGLMFNVASEHDIPYPLAYRPAGDAIVAAFPPVDLNGIGLDGTEVAKLIWERVFNEYDMLPYPDDRKIAFVQSEIELLEIESPEQMKQKLLEVAEHLKLDTVPFILSDNEGRFFLFSPLKVRQNSEAELGLDDLVKEMNDAGMAVRRVGRNAVKLTKRVGIYCLGGDCKNGFMFSDFALNSDRYKRFFKTLTISSSPGKGSPVVSRSSAATMNALQDELAELTEQSKDNNFPHKAGFEIHPSARVNAGNAAAVMEAQLARFKDLISYVTRKVFDPLHLAVKVLLAEDGEKLSSNILREYVETIQDGAIPVLAVAAQRIIAANQIFNKQMLAAREEIPSDALALGVALLDERERFYALVGDVADVLDGVRRKFSVDADHKASTYPVGAAVELQLADFYVRKYFSNGNELTSSIPTIFPKEKSGGRGGGGGSSSVPPTPSNSTPPTNPVGDPRGFSAWMNGSASYTLSLPLAIQYAPNSNVQSASAYQLMQGAYSHTQGWGVVAFNSAPLQNYSSSPAAVIAVATGSFTGMPL